MFLPRVDFTHGGMSLYYSMCDAFVMPPRSQGADIEGFGLVFLEANACGKPVIGSRAGGIPEAFVDGETGTLVGQEDVPALTKAIRHLLNPSIRERMGTAGRQRALREATWDHAADKIYAEMRNRV